MKTINVDSAIVEYTTEEKSYACYIREHDMYFSSAIDKGMEMIIRKTRAMIQAKENFIKEFPQYK